MGSEVLKKSDMSFELKDGSILKISQEDVKEITFKILAEGIIQVSNKCVLISEADTTLKKAELLFDVIKQQKDMTPEIRDSYLKRIGELVSESVTTYNGSDGNQYKKPPTHE